ncbi:MAG: hypothetical protein ACREQ7_23290 [Candidatus Binatia bacterium]
MDHVPCSRPLHCSSRRRYCRLPVYDSRAIGLALLTLSLFFPPIPRALATDDSYPSQQFVKYDKDSVSLAFSNLRAAEAAYLMRSTTGIAITLPPSSRTKVINLTLERANMDQAIRSLLTALELNNSFLVYDRDGRLTGVIALEKVASEATASDQEKKETSYRELTVKELESILRDFGRWSELGAEEQKTIHARLKTIPPSRIRDQVIRAYVRQVLEVPDDSSAADESPPKRTAATQASASSR